MWIIDLRSDTVTRPSPEMRKAMAEAEVGDDVFAEDPTVQKLQEETADLLGKEAALYCPTGCMTNQLAIAVQTQPGDEVILEENAHIFNYETTAASYLSRVQLHPLTAADRGILSVEEITTAIRSSAYYMPVTRLFATENTLNHVGGRVYPLEKIKEVTSLTKSKGILNHLDGARLWNACAASGISPKQYAEHFDTISVCFSKGLGAPVGSAFVGTKKAVEKARRFRKMWGGGMRQVGIIAAGALYALRNHRERMADDNKKAKRFAEIIANSKTKVGVNPDFVETNIVLLAPPEEMDMQQTLNGLKEKGVLLLPGNRKEIRAVTHLDVSMEDCEKAAKIVADYFA